MLPAQPRHPRSSHPGHGLDLTIPMLSACIAFARTKPSACTSSTAVQPRTAVSPRASAASMTLFGQISTARAVGIAGVLDPTNGTNVRARGPRGPCAFFLWLNWNQKRAPPQQRCPACSPEAARCLFSSSSRQPQRPARLSQPCTGRRSPPGEQRYRCASCHAAAWLAPASAPRSAMRRRRIFQSRHCMPSGTSHVPPFRHPTVPLSPLALWWSRQEEPKLQEPELRLERRQLKRPSGRRLKQIGRGGSLGGSRSGRSDRCAAPHLPTLRCPT